MRIIGITGPIGSGKSTVTGILFKNYSAKIVNADEISKDIVERDQKAYKEIVEFFGDNVLDRSGKLDRKKLAEIVFSDRDKLKKLNDITHKYIIDRIVEEIDRERSASMVQIIVLECIIPVKHGFIDVADEIWVVTADMETRIKRTMNRSGYSYSDAVNRINSQMAEEEYLKITDKVIYNNGDLASLEIRVKELIDSKF